MIKTSRVIKLSALLAAIAGHTGIAVLAAPKPQMQIEGGPGFATAKIGNSFADMAVGTMEAEEVTDVTDPVEPDLSEPIDVPEEAETAEISDAEPLDEVEVADSADPTVPEPAKPIQASAAKPSYSEAQPIKTPQALPDVPSEAIQLSAAPLAGVPMVAVPVAPQAESALMAPAVALTPAAMEPLTAAPVPVETALAPEPVKPEEVEVAQAVQEPSETLEASEPETAAVTQSLRPQRRKPEVEAKNVAEAKPTSKTKPKTQTKPRTKTTVKKKTTPKAASRGNGKENAVAGQVGGDAGSKSARSGSGGKKNQPGNARASNYPGLVGSTITRRTRMSGRGSAPVSISISASGKLTSVSSSNPRAAAAVRRVGRVPKPPAGARRSFSFVLRW